MRVHDVQGHLHGVKTELVGGREIQHSEMNEWILMASKTDETDLPCFPGFHQGFHRAAGCKDSVRVFQSDDFMELHQVDVISLQPPQGFFDLTGGRLFGAAVNLGHEEDFLTVTVTQSFPHSDLTDAVVIVPAVVHEGDPAVDRSPDNRYALLFVSLLPDMIPAEADGRDSFSSQPQRAPGHCLLHLGHQNLWTCAAQNRSRRGGFQERASAHLGLGLVLAITSAWFSDYRAHKQSCSVCSIGHQTGQGVHCQSFPRLRDRSPAPGTRRLLKNPCHHLPPEWRSDRFPWPHW